MCQVFFAKCWVCRDESAFCRAPSLPCSLIALVLLSVWRISDKSQSHYELKNIMLNERFAQSCVCVHMH